MEADEAGVQAFVPNDHRFRVARWHLDQTKSIAATTPDHAYLQWQHAIVATVFCAAAVEDRLTLSLCTPILTMEEEGPRRFVGGLLTRHVLRLPAGRKIDFLQEQVAEIKRNPILAKIRHLFERRNRIVHSTYTYKEVLMLRDQVYDPRFHGKVPESNLRLR